MPGRKKGRQKGASGSKAQSARKWNDAMREAREDLAMDRKLRLGGRGGDAAPPRLSASGFGSLARLLRQRVRADEIEEAALPAVRSELLAQQTAAAARRDFFSADWTALKEKDAARPRKLRSLLTLCVHQIGKDFLSYHADDDAVAQAFFLLPPPCLSRLSRSAAARGTVADHNIALLCSPGVSSLWLRGRFTDEGAGAVLPGLHESGTPTRGGAPPLEDAAGLSEVYRDGDAGDGGDGSGGGVAGSSRIVPTSRVSGRGAGGGEEREEWETADDRIEASLRGCISLTSLDVSSPRVTAGFIKRLVAGIPSLRRLGLRGSLGVVGGPDAVCDHVPRLAGLRELDVSHCTWFCDITLRRLARTLSLGTEQPGDLGRESQEIASAADQEQLDGSSGWGAASAPASAAAAAAAAASVEVAGLETPAAGPSVSAVVREGGGRGGGMTVAGSACRFRTITVVCASTAVTEKGARIAEAASPGLLVLFENQPAACWA